MAANSLRSILPRALLEKIIRTSHITEKPVYLSVNSIIESLHQPTDSGAHNIYKLYLRSVLQKEINSYTKEMDINLNIDVRDYF